MITYRKVFFSCFFLLFLFITSSIIFYPSLTFSQSNESQKFQVLKKDGTERITFPFTAINHERQNSSEYIFQDPILNNWILLINNNITYSDNPEAKTVVQIKEPYPSEKFIEITMFGDKFKKFFITVNTNETGYMRLYENTANGWYADNPVVLTHANVQGLSVTNGKRTVIDNLSLDGFNIGSIKVYGKDESRLPDSTSNGSIDFEVLYGDPSRSPLYFVPLIMLVGVGGLVIFFVAFKKRSLN
jgi:hypothetical protein